MLKLRRHKKAIVFSLTLLLPMLFALTVLYSGRASKSDQIKVQDLYYIETQLQDYYNQTSELSAAERLPQSLGKIDLSDLSGSVSDYTYRRQFTTEYGQSGDTEYQLCATFRKTNDKESDTYVYNDYGRHTRGENCFRIDAYQYSLFDGKYGDGTRPGQ